MKIPATEDPALLGRNDLPTHINGHLGPATRTWFEDMDITVDESASPVQTIIQVPMRDQAALVGLINRIRDLGLTLLSVTPYEQKEDS